MTGAEPDRDRAELIELVERARWAPRVYGDERKLHLDPTAVVNDALFNLSSGEITVAAFAFFGHGVSVLTGTHDIDTFDRERQVAVPRTGRDVLIGRGAWVSSNALVLGPCRIGEHAVVAAGSVVTGDVPAFAVVGGTPARVLRTITARPAGTPPAGSGADPTPADPTPPDADRAPGRSVAALAAELHDLRRELAATRAELAELRDRVSRG